MEFTFRALINWLMSASQTLRILLSASIILLSTGIWYIKIYYPLYEKKLRLHAQLHAFHQASQAADGREYLAQKQEQELHNARQLVTLYQTNTNNGAWLQSHIDFLLQQSQTTGINICACTLLPGQEKAWCKRYQARLQMKGSLIQLQNFFKKIEESKQLLHCKQISLAHLNDQIYTIDSLIDLSCVAMKNDLILVQN